MSGPIVLPVILDGTWFTATSVTSEKVIANCNNCSRKSFSGSLASTSNFLRHLKKLHPDQVEAYEIRKKEDGSKRRQRKLDSKIGTKKGQQPLKSSVTVQKESSEKRNVEYEETVETEAGVNTEAEVNRKRAIGNLLRTSSDPDLILEPVVCKIDPDALPGEDGSSEADDDQGDAEVVDEDAKSDFASPEDSDWQPDSFTPRRISERNVMRKAKLKGTKRASASDPSTCSGKRSNVTSSPEAILIDEVQGLRQEVRGINRNLEKLVDAQNRLNDNFERFFTSLHMRTN